MYTSENILEHIMSSQLTEMSLNGARVMYVYCMVVMEIQGKCIVYPDQYYETRSKTFAPHLIERLEGSQVEGGRGE